MKKNLVSIAATISEMSPTMDGFKIEVPVASGVDVNKLVEGDKDPMFVTIEVVNEGVSRSGRRYSRSVVESIANQINELKPEAYEGHLKESDRATARPKPVTLWIGAVTKEVKGKLRTFAKGYVMPYASELKQYLKAAKASGKQVAVSVYGQAKAVWDSLEKVYDLSDFNLESIDWARSGAEGVPSLGYLHLASEMKGDDIMTREEIIKDLKSGELDQFNPKLVSEMREETRKDLESNIKKRLERELASETAVIAEQLGAKDSDGALKVISEMQTELQALRRTVGESIIDNALIEKVPNKRARTIIRSLIISEMRDNFSKDNVVEVSGKVLRSEETKAIIKEMTTFATTISPVEDNKNKEPGRRFTVVK